MQADKNSVSAPLNHQLPTANSPILPTPVLRPSALRLRLEEVRAADGAQMDADKDTQNVFIAVNLWLEFYCRAPGSLR